MENTENQQERFNRPVRESYMISNQYRSPRSRPQFSNQYPNRYPKTVYKTGDLREHLNSIRQQNVNKSGPPPDPKYNFLADPSRDNVDEQENQPSSSNYRGNRNFRRSRGNFYGSYQTRGYRGQTRSRGRGRGYGNWSMTPGGRNEDNAQRDNELANSFSGMKIDENDKRNFNRNQNYSQYPPRNYQPDNRFYQGRGWRNNNVRFPRGSRGNPRRGRRNYKNVSATNIKVELDTATGEHKHSIEKVKINLEDQPKNDETLDIKAEENWEEDTEQTEDNTQENPEQLEK